MGAEPRTAVEMRDRMNRCRKLTRELFELDRPVMSAVDGVAYGFIRMHNLVDTADMALSATAMDIGSQCAAAALATR
jgi:hypothetical protein